MLLKQKYRAVWTVLMLVFVTVAKAQTLVWSDEFNQPKLNAEKWTTEVGGGGFGNGELQYYTSGESNVFIGSKSNPADTGYLVIEARRENYGVAPENRQFTSGRINTNGKFNFKYGSIEARIKLPDLQNGLWPAFWMLGANYPNVGWPKSGEIDILEAGFRDDWQNNVANKKTNTTVHWFQDNYLELVPNAHELGWWGNASATNSTTIEGNFYDDFHLFKLTWTPTEILGFVDGNQFYSFAIPPGDANFTEFSHPFFVILNLAVGGSNFVGITDPNQITAPMPAQMQVDYIRVFSNDSTETFQAANLPRETGNFGVYTETTTVTNSLGESPNIEVWNNLSAATSTAQEGSNVLAFTANPGNWFGMGIPTGASNVKNMQNFIDGSLHFHMKTTSSAPFSIGVISTANGNAQAGTQNKAVRIDPAGTTQFGLVRDGEWHEVIIPCSTFGNIEFRSINYMFYLVGDAPASAATFAIDNIYWSDGTKITPENGDYVIFADNTAGVDTFKLGTDGNFYVWENTLTAQVTTPAEGSNVLSFVHNNKGWFGAAFTASAMHNLTAFQNENAKLVFSMKTSDASTSFHIGMKSGTRDGEGQKWIAFNANETPYGFQRNGTWQTVEIPMSDFYDAVNLMEVTQMFQILGVGNIANIAIDNIRLTGGGAALPDVGANAAPVVNAGSNQTVRFPTDSVYLSGSAIDSDGTVASYQWSVQSGPNSPVLEGDTTAALVAKGLVQGTYVFKLTATDDDGATGSDNVTVFVGENLTPLANAGVSRTISQPADSVAIQGSGSDADGSIVSYAWTRESGPNMPTLVGANTSQLGAMDLTQGTYVFKLTVTDNEGGTGYDTMHVVVLPNTPPTANAGADQEITLPTNSITINGSGTDTGFISSYAWSTTTGPNTPTLTNQNSASVTASNLVAGTYILMLTVTDNGGLSDIDSVKIIVNEAPVNLALNKTAVASTIENAGTPASNAVDGNLGSRWSSAFADPQWIYVDLGDSYHVNTVKVTWEPAYGKDYLVQVSEDASNWTTVKTITNNNTLVNNHTGLTGTGRYVRIYGTVRALPYGYSIYEIEVYGTPNDAPDAPVVDAGDDVTISLPITSTVLNGSASDSDGTVVKYRWSLISGPGTPQIGGSNSATASVSNLQVGTYVLRLTATDNDSLSSYDDVNVIVAPRANLALNKPTLFSSAESDGTLGANAVDGNLATRWSSAFFDPNWIYVDLGQVYAIGEVKITWEGAYGKDYQIQLSNDANNWTTVKSVVGNTTLVNDHTDISGSGRYVRIYGTQRGTPWGYSIFELEVYEGVTNTPPTANIEEGEEIVVELPQTSIQLHGSGNDSDGSIASYAWTVVDGPLPVSLENENTATVTVSDLTFGTHVFRLTVTDNNGATASDDINVFVNYLPTADAGEDRNITLPQDTVILSGSGEDYDGAVAAYSWSQVSGPNNASLFNASQPSVSVGGLVAGTYVFRLTAEDNLGSSGSDEITVIVHPAVVDSTNLALFKSVTVSSTESGATPGSAAVDGNVNTKWASIASATQWISVDLNGIFDISRVKIIWGDAYARNFKIQISIDGTKWKDLKTVTGNTNPVNEYSDLKKSGRYVRIYCTMPQIGMNYVIRELEVYEIPNIAPTVEAGSDIFIALPNNDLTITGIASDSDGTIEDYSWTTKVGPFKPVLQGANTATMKATDLVPGTYIFKLTVTDNGGLKASDEVKVIVKKKPMVASRMDAESSNAEISSEVYFYPNPAKNTLHVKGLKNGSPVRMMTVTGASSYDKTVVDESVDISDVPPGLYVLDCFNGVEVIRAKVIKE